MDERLDALVNANARLEALLGEIAQPTMYAPIYDEGQRQIILLALFKLKRERPGWADAIARIEGPLGGQLDWPE